MSESKSRFDALMARIKNHRLLSAMLVLGTIVIALASFTNAAKSLLGLIPGSRPDVNGQWSAPVTYDWISDATRQELFKFTGSGEELLGSATYGDVPRGILEGKVVSKRLSFITKTTVYSSGEPRQALHRYNGVLDGQQIRFVLQTENTFIDHAPIEFIARRDAGAKPTS